MTAPTGSIKRDPATGSVAVATALHDPDHAWGVMTTSHGGYYTDDAEVEDWETIYLSGN